MKASVVCVAKHARTGNGGNPCCGPYTGYQIASATEFYWRIVGEVKKVTVQQNATSSGASAADKIPGFVSGSAKCICSSRFDP